MDLEQKIKWLSPERNLKLYGGKKSHFGFNRLMVIGIGRQGIDSTLRCMHITQRRFGFNDNKIRFMLIGTPDEIEASEYEGTMSGQCDALSVVPEEAIYPYLNDPEKLPENAKSWFDEGLVNYTPNPPKYGLMKRQCGRIALFHMIDRVLEIARSAKKAFSENDKPIDVIITGNLGDANFGGMFIDLAYIFGKILGELNCTVKVKGYFYAADIMEPYITDRRDFAQYAANTLVSKKELDKFQSRRKQFSQSYTSKFSVESDKPPFTAAFLIPAGEDYNLVMEQTAEKILCRMEVLSGKEDNAERIMSYNAVNSEGSHAFRYLSFGVSGTEVPIGKIIAYLSIKLLSRLRGLLRENNVGTMLLNRYTTMVSPSLEYAASLNGKIPTIEFDEKANYAFSVRQVKSGNNRAAAVADRWVNDMSNAVINGAKLCSKQIAGDIISECEAARVDFLKGPYYAEEILKRCLSVLKKQITNLESEQDTEADVRRAERLERAAYKRVKYSGLMAREAVSQYLFELKNLSGAKVVHNTHDAMLTLLKSIRGRLAEYYDSTVKSEIEKLNTLEAELTKMLKQLKAKPDSKSCMTEVFSLYDARVSIKLDKLAEEYPEDILERHFRLIGFDCLDDDDETSLAREIIGVVTSCFEPVLSRRMSELCEYFGIESNRVRECMRKNIEGCEVKAPVSDSLKITRIICPKAVRKEDIEELRHKYKGVEYIWNGSVCGHTTVTSAICGGARIEEFKGYEYWENMHYAYVNDALKKRGMKLF